MFKIATIIANYNYGDKLIPCIESALNCIKDNIKHKIVVVDDGSSDDSCSRVLDKYKFSSQYTKNENNVYCSDELDFISTKNGGASYARNLAMKHSWGFADFFHILDSDDKIMPNKLVAMSKKMEDQNIGVVYADYIIQRPLYNKIEFKYPYDQKLLQRNCIVHSGSLIRKRFLELVQLPNGDIYDEKLHGPASQSFIGCTEDYDLWLRLARVCIMCHIPEPLTYVNEHGKNQSMKMTDEVYRQNMEVMKTR
jgi:glycosyltransferase involved in cell wall biosynthesis